MKLLIYLLIGIFMIGIASAEITCSESIDRTVPSTATGNFQVTYQASGTSGQWGASIEDSLTGGCTFPSGSTTYKTVMLSEDGNSKTITINAPSSATCTFTGGDYLFGTCNIGTFSDDSITIGTGDPCTDSTWTPATSTVCSGNSFTQNSNCGNTRSATGTKDCEPSGGVCGDGTCDSDEDFTSCPSDCEEVVDKCDFWEKKDKDTGECGINTGMLVLIGIGLFAFKILTG